MNMQKPQSATAQWRYLVAAGILLSRIAGLVRDRVFAHYFGLSAAADAFRAALRIPNFLQTLFGEGVLSASFIPGLRESPRARKARRSRTRRGRNLRHPRARHFGLVLLGVFATPLIIDVIAAGFHRQQRALTIPLVRILFPGAGLLVMSAWCLGILNSHRRFFLSYSASVLWNLAMIGALCWLRARMARDRLAIIVAWASVREAPFSFWCNCRCAAARAGICACARHAISKACAQ